jgi:RNA polymerase sigma factor (sigma-70 family)
MEPSDEELLVASGRDPHAFAAFYRRHAVSLTAFFLQRTGDRERAADLAAETFAAALQGRRRFDPSKGAAVAWLYGIARHLLAHTLESGRVEDRARRRLGIPRLELDDDAFERVEAAASGAQATELLGGLPPDERAAVEARVIAERDYAEIARAEETTELAIRKRVSRGLARLRAHLDKRDEGRPPISGSVTGRQPEPAAMTRVDADRRPRG